MRFEWRSAFWILLLVSACSAQNNGIIDIFDNDINTEHPGDTDSERDVPDTESASDTDSELSSDGADVGTCSEPLDLLGLLEETSPGVYQLSGELPDRPSAHSGSCSMDTSAGPEVVYVFESPMDGTVAIHLEGADPLLHVRTTCDDPSTEVVCNDDYEHTNSMVYLEASAGATYYLFADAFSEFDVSPYVLTVDTDPPPFPFTIPDGIWEAEAYGIVITSMDNVIQWFETTDISCILWEAGPLPNFAAIVEDAELTDDDRLALSLVGGTVPILFTPVDAAPDLCADGGTPMIGAPAYERDPLVLFDIFATTFRDHYPFFEERGVDWEAITQTYRDDVTDTISDEALFDLFGEMIQPLDDYHVSIENDTSEIESGLPPVLEMLLAEFESEGGDDFFEYFWVQMALMAENAFGYLVDAPEGDPELFAWGRLPGNVGYLRIMEFDADPDLYVAAVEAALTDLADTNTLVIDVRINFGGFNSLGRITAGYFTEAPVEAMTSSVRYKNETTPPQTVVVEPLGERYTGRVVVMTSESTPSAAEGFTLMMRALPQVTLFGEATLGIVGSRMKRLLPNGWSLSVTKEICRTMDDELFEVVGIPPDVPVSPMVSSLEDRLMGVDVGLEALLSWLETE